METHAEQQAATFLALGERVIENISFGVPQKFPAIYTVQYLYMPTFISRTYCVEWLTNEKGVHTHTRRNGDVEQTVYDMSMHATTTSHCEGGRDIFLF